ncbi:hypothetical protein [Rhodococcus erythropolis]|uniref:hypothetical protein n=1 Tax=Rhodococcus erythropolis TaxID=1833 RepID=UPI001F3E1126|nr:hypothetical protein [Rhodococcus erythropolis]
MKNFDPTDPQSRKGEDMPDPTSETSYPDVDPSAAFLTQKAREFGSALLGVYSEEDEQLPGKSKSPEKPFSLEILEYLNNRAK